MTEDAQDEASDVPLLGPGGALEQGDGILDPAVLVVVPGVPPELALAEAGDGALERGAAREGETGADEDGLDTEPVEGAKVGLNEVG